MILKLLNPIFLLAAFALPLYGQDFIEVADSLTISEYYGMPVLDGGGGVSAVDFNQDGLDDLTFATAIDRPLLFYINEDSVMTLMNPAPVTNTLEVKCVLWIDYDNDGDLDFFATAYDGPNRLYRNDGGLTMTDVTSAAGLPTTNSTSTGAAASDFDRDGDLDLYICNYGIPVAGMSPDTNFFYQNNGDGTFTDITATTGTADSTRQSWCATFFDYNNDGWEDLYVANDRIEYQNSLYENNGDGTFTDVSAASGCDITIFAMNAGVGDYDNNGYHDVYVTNIIPSTLHKNNGDGTFTDVAQPAGVIFDRIGWGGNFFDYDHDLDLDLYVCSGRELFTEPNAFYVNQGDGTFTEPYFSTGGLGGIDVEKSHCNTILDFNNDGLPDIAVSHDRFAPFHIWQNTNAIANHWFKVHLTGTQSNKDAVGAGLEMWIDGVKYLRTVLSHDAFYSQNSMTKILGTGAYAFIDSLVIKWPFPSGGMPYTKETIPGAGIKMGAVNEFVEGQGCNCSNPTVHLVTSTANDGPASLRQLIANSCPCDTIRLDPILENDTITLSGGPLGIEHSLNIEGFDQSNVVVRVEDSQTAFMIPYGIQVSVAGIEFLDAAPVCPDPVIQNAGLLTMEDVKVNTLNVLLPDQRLIESVGTIVQRGATEIGQ